MHLVLLRGLAREAGHWLEFPASLQQQLGSEWKIHLPDFPGCGRRFQQPALTNIADMTDYLRIQLAPFRDEPVYVMGISMGGMVALDWAQRFPAELAGIILLNSSAGDQPVSWRLRPRAWLLMLAALVSPVAMRESMVLRQVSNRADLYPAHLREWLRLQLLHPVSRRTLMTMLVAAARFRPLAQCNVPGLVLASEADRLVNVKASLELASRFAWPCILHPHSGHDLPLDAPDWLVTEVSHWLTR
jgi:pimeloyl-[acyl-carrier protein] methyl ester esterase